MASAFSLEVRNLKHCFTVPGRVGVSSPRDPGCLTLSDRQAESFAQLLPLLGCGEEAAALAFDGLAICYRDDDVIAASLKLIAHEERIHEALLFQIKLCLPEAQPQAHLVDRAQRLHIGLQRGGTTHHLARIAALDSAVCTLLSRLLDGGGPIGADPLLSRTLARIRRDEAGHVRLSRELASGMGAPAVIHDAAAEARNGLADLLRLVGYAFETLGVDADLLDRDIRRLPNGLFAG